MEKGKEELPPQTQGEKRGLEGKGLAGAIGRKCMECKIKIKDCQEQRIGSLPTHCVGFSSVLKSVAIDLTGPIEFQGTVNKRQTGKRQESYPCVQYCQFRCSHGHCGVLFVKKLPKGCVQVVRSVRL
jgi:hypothetical protein